MTFALIFEIIILPIIIVLTGISLMMYSINLGYFIGAVGIVVGFFRWMIAITYRAYLSPFLSETEQVQKLHEKGIGTYSGIEVLVISLFGLLLAINIYKFLKISKSPEHCS